MQRNTTFCSTEKTLKLEHFCHTRSGLGLSKSTNYKDLAPTADCPAGSTTETVSTWSWVNQYETACCWPAASIDAELRAYVEGFTAMPLEKAACFSATTTA